MMQTNIIITAGPMRAWIDDVRFITNARSGKMGYALYEEAINMGFPTTLIMGKVPYIEDKLRDRNDVIFVETNDELFEAITLIQTRKIAHFPIVMVSHDYWDDLVKWIKTKVLNEHHNISKEDLDIPSILR